MLVSHTSLAFDWQGHRGARGIYPENTIGSMQEALKWPITTLELDVVISKDHKVVVSHEPWFNQEMCQAPEGNLYQLDYEQIQKVDCGSKLHPRFPHQSKVSVGKPLLGKLLEEVNSKKVFFNVEIKSTIEDEKKGYQPDIQTFTDLVMKELLAHLPAARIIIQSFDWRVLKYMKEKYPSIKLSALSEQGHTPENVIKSLGFTPEIYSPDYKTLTTSEVEKFHATKMKVIPWTINSVKDMQAVKAMGVDGIITDYPNLIPEVEQKKCPSGFNNFENRCVKIPTHALATDKNPGWVCKIGYQQKRNKCLKIIIPSNAYLLEDGKNWACQQGYVRYRSVCKKK